MSKQKVLYYDLETTGTNLNRHSVHEIAAMLEVDGEIVDRFVLSFAPHPKAELDPKALEIRGHTADGLRARQYPYEQAYQRFIGWLGRHVDKYNKSDKVHLCGYNNRGFDDQFLRRFFEHNGNPYFGSWFYSDSFDAMVFASYYLRAERHQMENFKQGTVAAQLGISVDEEQLHSALYDVQITRQIWEIVTNLDSEDLTTEFDLLQ